MKIHIEIKPEIKKKIDEIKDKEGASINWTVNKAILNYLKLKKKVVAS